MPGGRPKNPGTAEDRAEAKRERIRLNVLAHRHRKKWRESQEIVTHPHNTDPVDPPSTESASCSSVSPPWSDHDYLAVDIARHSRSPPIDLDLGTIPAIINDFYACLGRYPWPLATQQLRSRDRIVDIAVVAAGARWLGRMFFDDAMIRFSRLAYHKTLQSLQSHLASLDVKEVLVLNTVNNALMVFETLDGSVITKGDRWRSHVNGGAALMQNAGPKFYNTPLGLSILRGFRPTILFTSSFARRASFLDTDEWRRIPHSRIPPTDRDKLWQLAERIPRLLERSDALKRSILHPETTATLTLWHDMKVLRNQLLAWFSSYSSAATKRGGLLFTVQASTPSFAGDELVDVFPSSIYFMDLATTDTIVNYWCSLLQLLVVYVDVQNLLECQTTVHDEDHVLEDEVAAIATDICRSMEYIFGFDDRDLKGILFCGLLPLWCAMQYFAGDGTRYARELRWCAAVGNIINRRGLTGPAYLFSQEALQGDANVPWRHLLGRAIKMPDSRRNDAAGQKA